MKKGSLLLSAGFSVLLTGSALAQTIIPCNTYNAMEDNFNNNPAARQRYEQVQQQLDLEYQSALQTNGAAQKTAGTVYTIPVVFHILHQYGTENIPDQTIINALAQVNKDYRKQGSDINTINSQFVGIYQDAEIEFKLAHLDPNGNCTSGIVHHYDANTDWQQSGSCAKYGYSGTGAGQWDPSKYLNVYIVKNIIPAGGVISGGVIVGYTYLPGSAPCANGDAIVYRYDYLTGLQARSLSHEIGHWFNLAHTFGNTNNPGVSCGDDGVADTPPTVGFFSTCPTPTSNACSSSLPNVENFMDYSSCPKMFTQDQVTRMRTAVVSSIANRSNLWTTANLAATGVNNTGLCAPIADFTSNRNTICAGQTVTYTDISTNGAPTSWTWNFQSGSPTSTVVTTSTASVTYNTPGTYSVSMTASNSGGSNTVTKTNIITVKSIGADVSTAYSESFEGSGLPSNFDIYNVAGTTWAQTSTAAATGSKCFYINGAANTTNQTDALITPSYNLSALANVGFQFKYAYAQKATAGNDRLRVLVSTDCGVTWAPRYQPSGSTLATNGGGLVSNFVPGASDWKTVPINLSGFTNATNVMFRFEFISDNAGNTNNFYLDDINVDGTVGINELESSIGLELYPNPSNGESTLQFDLNSKSSVQVYVTNMLGQTVETASNQTMDAGANTVKINTGHTLQSGIYLVNMLVNNQRLTKKLVIQ